jgi:tetratricopeptide (TPR) repeat protein
MTRRQRTKGEPLERDIEAALDPGAFIPDRACSEFVNRLEAVAARIGKLAATEPARSSALHETFLAGCFEKARELDDSSGSFGQFVDQLFCGWIRARQAAGAAPQDTASRLLAWIDDDPYGFCSGIEKDVAKAFDKAGLAAFEKLIRARFDAAATAIPTADGTAPDRREYQRRRWSEVLRALYVQQRALTAYISLAEESGLTAADCLAVARLLAGRRKPQDALTWIERGIDLDQKIPHGSTAAFDLARLKRDVLTRLGRGSEALDAAWADFRKHPGKYTYDDLMKFVPRGDRATWHDRAIAAALGADLHSLIELLIATKEIARLAELVQRSTETDLEDLSHYVSEPAAKKLEKTVPAAAAWLWRAQGMRIIAAKKSKYYHAALANFERAKRCYERAGLTTDWDNTVSQARAEHHRKTGFMSGFEELVRGSGPSDQPSFLARAKARWVRRDG